MKPRLPSAARSLSGITGLLLFAAACAPAPPAAAPATAPPKAAPTTAKPAAAATAPAAAASPAAASKPAPASGPVRIGASLPLTGAFAEPGQAAKKGYEVWVDTINSKGGLLGRKVELIVYDDASKVDQAVSDYEKLITVDKVDLVVGPFSSKLVIPTSEVAAKYNYAFPEPAGGAPHVFDRGLKNIFFAQPAIPQNQGRSFSAWVLSLPADQRPKSAAYVMQDDPFVQPVIEGIRSALEPAGIKTVVREIYPPETTDFSSIAARVKASGAELIAGGTVFEDSVGQIRAYQEAGFQPRIAYFTTGPSLPKEFKEALGDKTEAIMANISWHQDMKVDGNQEFVAAYRKKFGAQDDIAEDSANAYTVGQLIEQAAKQVGSLDNQKLIAAMHAMTFDTIVGKLKFDEAGRPQGSFMTLQWQKGRPEIVLPPDTPARTASPIFPKPKW